MHASPTQVRLCAPSTSNARAVASMLVHERNRDAPAVAIPCTQAQVVVRFGPSVRGGLDVHAVGVRTRVHRKLIGGGHWSVIARLCLDTQQAVLGVPASAITGRIVTLEDLWGESARQLRERLVRTRGPDDAAVVLETAIAQRLAVGRAGNANTRLALAAADALAGSHVREVARALGVSDRHLRRVFQETVGVSPKAFAKLARFRRALRAGREQTESNWASIAAATGYYDQAHLIAEFRAIAGVTPCALLRELRAPQAIVTP